MPRVNELPRPAVLTFEVVREQLLEKVLGVCARSPGSVAAVAVSDAPGASAGASADESSLPRQAGKDEGEDHETKVNRKTQSPDLPDC